MGVISIMLKRDTVRFNLCSCTELYIIDAILLSNVIWVGAYLYVFSKDSLWLLRSRGIEARLL